MNMRRPDNITGQIRYFGIALTEIAAECYEKGIKFQFEINTKPIAPVVEVRFYDTPYNVKLGTRHALLNQFEANIEAEMEAAND